MFYVQEQNGFVECDTQTMMERIRKILHVKGMLKLFVGKITNPIVHVLNRAMTWIMDELTPFEMWIGDRLDVLHF
jgi:hypothetical protein